MEIIYVGPTGLGDIFDSDVSTNMSALTGLAELAPSRPPSPTHSARRPAS